MVLLLVRAQKQHQHSTSNTGVTRMWCWWCVVCGAWCVVRAACCVAGGGAAGWGGGLLAGGDVRGCDAARHEEQARVHSY